MLTDKDFSRTAVIQEFETHKIIPSTLQDTLMERVSALNERKPIAQAAAVLGRTFSIAMLAKVMSRDVKTTAASVKSLVSDQIFVPTLISPDTYSFRHALVQDAAYESLLRQNRARLHERIAAILARDYPDIQESQPEILAFHFDCSHNGEEAVEWYLKSGRRLNAVSAFLEAESHLKRALELLTAQAATPARLRQELAVCIALGVAEAGLHGFSASSSGKVYERALAICRDLGDPPEIFPILSGAGSYHITRSEFGKSKALARECLERARFKSEIPPLVMGHRLLGGTLFLTGALEPAVEQLNKAVDLYDQDPTLYMGDSLSFSLDHKSTALCYLGLALCVLGYLDKGLEAGRRALEHSQSLGNRHTVNFSLTYLAAMHHFRGDDPETEQVATESLELALSEGFGTWEGVSRMIRGEFWVGKGLNDQGIADILAGMKAHRSTEATTYQPFGISLLVKGLVAIGKLSRARAALHKAIELTETTGECWYHAELLRMNAELHMRAGELAKAEEILLLGLEIARLQRARLWELRCSTLLSQVLLAGGKQCVAVDVLEPVYQNFSEGRETAPMREARDCLERMATVNRVSKQV